jgi:hypothetical protein
MALQSEILSALETHSDKLTDGAASHLAALWRSDLATADPAILPDFIAGRLTNPMYAGFMKSASASVASPSNEPVQQDQPTELPLDRSAREYRERMIRANGYVGWIAGNQFTAEEVARVKQADTAAANAQRAQAPPWYRPGMTPMEADVARVKYQRANDGSNWLHR